MKTVYAIEESPWRWALASHQLAIFPVIAAAILVANVTPANAQALPDRIKEFIPGKNAGFGADYFPDNALGPPQGTLDPQTPNDRQQDILSLGTGGSITYEFTTHRIIDLPGPDVTVFENPVQPNGHPEQSFVDSAIVSVSADGTAWHTFPVDLISSKTVRLAYKSNYVGFAGVNPTFSSTANGLSPYDSSISGGDSFDLADLDLTAIRFIKIQDTGDARFRPTYDIDGDLIIDYGSLLDPDPSVLPPLGISAGFDIDAIAAIHTEPWSPPASVTGWHLYD